MDHEKKVNVGKHTKIPSDSVYLFFAHGKLVEPNPSHPMVLGASLMYTPEN